MYVRLAFSVSAHLDPEILLLDEVLAVGDRAFQQKCLERIGELTHSGRTVIFVSHDVGSIARLCQRGIVLREGRIVFDGEVDQAVAAYLASTPLGGDDSAAATRKGTGELRFERVVVSGPDGDALVDPARPLTMRVDLRGGGGVRSEPLTLELGIHGMQGGLFVLLSTDYDPAHPFDSSLLRKGATVTCELEELPLRPGRYVVSASLQRPNGETVDAVPELGSFAVAPTDYYGTGFLAGETHGGPVLVRHRWQVAPQSDPGVGVRISEAV